MSSLTLYDAADELCTLFDTLEGLEDPQQIAEFEKEMEPAFERALKKVEGFSAFLRHLDWRIQFCKDEARRINSYRQRFEETRERLTGYAIRSMHASGLRLLGSAAAQLRLQQNPPSVVIDDQTQLPWDLRKVTVEMTLDQWARLTAAVHDEETTPALRILLMDIWNANPNVSDAPIKSAIAAALKAGEEVPGARLIREDRLVVK